MRVSFRRYDKRIGLVTLLCLALLFITLVTVSTILLSKVILASSLSKPTLISLDDGAVTKGAKYTVSWSSVPGAVAYNYESYHDSEGMNKRWSTKYTSSSTTFTNIADSVYWWRVQAVDASGNKSEWSSLWKVTVDSVPPSLTITAVSPEAQLDYYGSHINVTAAVSNTERNMSTYYAEVTNPGGTVSKIGPVAASDNSNSFSLDTSFGSGSYVITYTATDRAGNFSTVSRTLNVDTLHPETVTLLGVVDRYMQPGSVSRTWTKSQTQDVYGYVYKSFKSYDDALNNTATLNYNFIHTTIENGNESYILTSDTGPSDRTFYYRVVAIDKAGNKTWSNEIHSVTVDGTPPPAPSLQINDLTNGALTNKTAITATWNKPSEDTLKYNLRYYTNIPGSSNTQATPLVTELTAEQWSGVLGEGTGQYTFQVQAIDRAGNESPWSDLFVINLDVAAPDAPALTVSNEKGSVATNATTKHPALTAEWNKPSDDTTKYTYQYWNDISASPWKESTPNTFESTTQTWSGDLEGGSGTYYLRVQATDAAGNTSPWSDIFVINLDTIPPTVIVNPITSIETPNSATITATIQDPTITKVTIVITGATGGVVTNTEVTVINGVVTYELATPAVDTYTVTVTAKDVADNETTSLAQTFTVKAHVVIAPEEKPAVPVNSGSSNNTPANPAPADDDTAPAGNAVAQNTAPDAEGEVFDDTDAAQNPQPRANAFGVDGGGTNDAQEIQGTTDTKAFDWGFGVPWWGWLFGIATIAGGWWIIAGIRRRRQQDE